MKKSLLALAGVLLPIGVWKLIPKPIKLGVIGFAYAAILIKLLILFISWMFADLSLLASWVAACFDKVLEFSEAGHISRTFIFLVTVGSILLNALLFVCLTNIPHDKG